MKAVILFEKEPDTGPADPPMRVAVFPVEGEPSEETAKIVEWICRHWDDEAVNFDDPETMPDDVYKEIQLAVEKYETVAVTGSMWSSKDYYGEYDEGFDIDEVREAKPEEIERANLFDK